MVEGDVLEDVLLILPIQEISVGDRKQSHTGKGFLRWSVIDLHDTVRLDVRQRLQQGRIHYIKDGSIRADSQRQDRYRQRGEAEILAQHTNSKAKVLRHALQHRPSPRLVG